MSVRDEQAMVTRIRRQMTAAEFEAYIALPENSERRFELIGGEIVEVPSNPFVSEIAMRISIFIGMYLLQHAIKGRLTGEAGGYMVNGERYAPDVAYISYARQPQLAQKGYNPNPPELAVEVISDPTSQDEQTTLRRKITNYLQAGVIVWVVNPYARFVEVHHPEKPLHVLDEGDTLTGDEVLPGFTLAVKDIFPAEVGEE